MAIFTTLLILSLTFYFNCPVNSIKYVDLTYPIGLNTPLHPVLRKFELHDEGLLEGDHHDQDADWIASSYFTMSEHTSTHIDSPYHVFPKSWTLTEIPMERMLNVPGVMIDMSWKITKTVPVKRDYAIVREDILDWERKNGIIPTGSVIFVRTGWGEKFLTDPVDFLGTEPKCCSFPGLAFSAAKVFGERGVFGVGIDTVSLDVGYTTIFPVHTYLGSRNIFLLENVANLHILPPRGFNVFLFPLKIEGGTASPVRIFATVP